MANKNVIPDKRSIITSRVLSVQLILIKLSFQGCGDILLGFKFGVSLEQFSRESK